MVPKWKQRMKGTDALDRPRVRLTPRGTLERPTGEDSGTYPLALFDDLATAWAGVKAAAAAQVAKRPWERVVERGKTYLLQWRETTTHAARTATDDAPPDFLPLVGARVGPVLPARRWRQLQPVLDQHDPGRRVEEVPIVRRPPGKPHPKKMMTDWDRYCARIDELRRRPRNSFTPAEIGELAALYGQWRGARRCAGPSCLQFLRQADRRKYCSPACRQAPKKGRGRGRRRR